MAFEPYTVVRVPFPFAHQDTQIRRPALVLSQRDSFNTPSGHYVMAMITSSRHAPWPLDCPIDDLASAGLPAPSVIRFKLFTLDNRLVLGALGHLSPGDMRRIDLALRQLIPSFE